MFLAAFSCALLMLSWLDVSAMGQQLTTEYRVRVTGHLPPKWSVAGMEFQVDGHVAGGCPRIIEGSTSPGAQGEICSFWAPIGRHSLAASVWVSGYKRLSLKLPDFTIKDERG